MLQGGTPAPTLGRPGDSGCPVDAQNCASWCPPPHPVRGAGDPRLHQSKSVLALVSDCVLRAFSQVRRIWDRGSGSLPPLSGNLVTVTSPPPLIIATTMLCICGGCDTLHLLEPYNPNPTMHSQDTVKHKSAPTLNQRKDEERNTIKTQSNDSET